MQSVPEEALASIVEDNEVLPLLAGQVALLGAIDAAAKANEHAERARDLLDVAFLEAQTRRGWLFGATACGYRLSRTKAKTSGVLGPSATLNGSEEPSPRRTRGRLKPRGFGTFDDPARHERRVELPASSSEPAVPQLGGIRRRNGACVGLVHLGRHAVRASAGSRGARAQRSGSSEERRDREIPRHRLRLGPRRESWWGWMWQRLSGRRRTFSNRASCSAKPIY